jgi:hypothetical protein
MKKIIIACALAFIATLSFGSAADAGEQVVMNCDAFSRSPFVCVKNNSAFSVAAIDCDGQRAQALTPSGFIGGGQVGVVKFPKANCGHLSVVTTDNRVRSGFSFDAKNATTMIIPGWSW